MLPPQVGIRHYTAAPNSTTLRLRSSASQHNTPPSSTAATTKSTPQRAMATFSFDPTPFLPPNHQCIDVEGRPSRVHVLAGAVLPTHEDWAIASIVPMPNLSVDFNIVRGVLSYFLTDKHLGFSEISPCHLGKHMTSWIAFSIEMGWYPIAHTLSVMFMSY